MSEQKPRLRIVRQRYVDNGPDWASRRQQAYARRAFSRVELVVIAFAIVAVAIVVIAGRGA